MTCSYAEALLHNKSSDSIIGMSQALQEAVPADKNDKGRLKKLLKRASVVQDDKPLSGIFRESEWTELSSLCQERQIENERIKNPVVLFRHGKAPERVVEASDHRDIFFRVLNACNKTSNKKRRRDSAAEDDLPKVPSWGCLHNPVAVDQVAVLELEVDTPEQLRILQSAIQAKVNATTKHSLCSLPTRWFPGNQPKSMSSQLLYAQRPKPKRSSSSNGKTIQTIHDLYQVMSDMVLTEEQLIKESFPRLLADSKEERENLSVAEAQILSGETRPMSISHEQALDIVGRVKLSKVTHEDPKGEDQGLAPYVVSLKHDDPNRMSKIFAMDCEMVRTTAGMELARITLIRISAFSPESTETEVVFDEIVRPTNRVVDYLTQYSGITPEMYKDDEVCVSIEQVQAAILSTIADCDIVVGHSLENDCQAARWIHSRVVDTSVIFRDHGQSFKYSLRHLAGRLLKREIQTSDHCSEEDALAALQLAVRRAVEGSSFGFYNNRPVNRLFEVEGTVVCVGPAVWIQEFVTAQPNSIHALNCEDVRDPNCKAISAYTSMVGKTRRARLVYAHLKVDVSKESAVFEGLLSDLLEKMSKSTMVMIALQSGFAAADTHSKLKSTRMNPKSTLDWSESDEEARMVAVKQCQIGWACWVSLN